MLTLKDVIVVPVPEEDSVLALLNSTLSNDIRAYLIRLHLINTMQIVLYKENLREV